MAQQLVFQIAALVLLSVSVYHVEAQTPTTVFLVANASRRIICDPLPDTNDLSWSRVTPLGDVPFTEDVNQRIYVVEHLPSLSKTLVISRALPFTLPPDGDFGAMYQCVLNNQDNPRQVYSYTIQPARAPTSYNLRPPPNQTHVEDLDLVITLSCEADGATSPDARAEWTIFLANGEVRRENTTRLMVPVIRENNGLYMCQLINIVGSLDPVNSTLIINYVPGVNISSGSVNESRIVAGSDLNLTCMVNTQPFLTRLEFVFENRSVNSSIYQSEVVLSDITSPSQTTDVVYSRVITDVMRYANSGVFYCRATNVVGVRNSSIYVTVIDPPSAPQNLTLVNHTQDEVTVDWFPPSNNGGSELTHYDLNCTATTGIRHEFSDRVDTNTSIRNVTVQVFPITSESINSTNRHTFSGLFGGETYDCGLGAINFAGPGELSNRITFTTPADAPCAPLVETDTRANMICVRWTLRCTGGEAITGCSLSRRSSGETSVLRTYSSNDPECQATGEEVTLCDTEGLVLGRRYDYIFTVMNSIGSSEGRTSTVNQDPIDPTATITISTAKTKASSLSNGAIAGIIVAGVVLLCVILVITIIVLKSDRTVVRTNNAPRVVADPATEPTGLKYTKTGSSSQTAYTNVQTIQGKPKPVAASTAAQQTPTQYAAVDPQRTKSFGSQTAEISGNDTVV